MSKIRVLNDETPAEVLAESIKKISDGMKIIEKSRLTDDAVVTLLADSTKVAKGTIRTVLKGLKNLEIDYLKPVKKTPAGAVK
jgi:hypothetical protein